MNRVDRYAISLSENSEARDSRLINRTNLPHVRFGKNYSSDSCAFRLPTLAHAVRSIVAGRSQEEMIGIHAQWIVAPMAYALPRRDWTDV